MSRYNAEDAGSSIGDGREEGGQGRHAGSAGAVSSRSSSSQDVLRAVLNMLDILDGVAKDVESIHERVLALEGRCIHAAREELQSRVRRSDFEGPEIEIKKDARSFFEGSKAEIRDDG